MTVWLLVILLANGEQAEAASLWRSSKYECERLRHTLETGTLAAGSTSKCLAWDVPENFAPVRSDAPVVAGGDAADGDNSRVLRRLQELSYKIDALDTSMNQVGNSTKKLGTDLRKLDSSIKRVEGSVHSLRCYR